MSTWGKYCITTFLYGAIRKPFVLKDAKVGDYKINNGKREEFERDMLVTEKAVLTVCGGFLGQYTWPIYLYLDLMKIEKKVRGIEQTPTSLRMWGYRNNDVFDYVFI